MHAYGHIVIGYMHPAQIPETIPRPADLTPVPLCIPGRKFETGRILVFTQNGQPGVCIAEWARDPSKVESQLAANQLLGIFNPVIEYSVGLDAFRTCAWVAAGADSELVIPVAWI